MVFQYTVYYPGNIPLVIVAGHGGSDMPGEPVPARRRLTHRFKRIPDLINYAGPINPSTFSEPVQGNGEEGTGEPPEEKMPWMPRRDVSRGGNFIKDLNTYTVALNLANAVTCITGGPMTNKDGTLMHEDETKEQPLDDDVNNRGARAGADLPRRCLEQGPWGDNEVDPPIAFPPNSTSSSTTSSSRSSQSSTFDDDSYEQQNYPHVVVFRVPRMHVDVNRNLTHNAIADGSPTAEAAWHEYHDLIDHIRKMTVQQQHSNVQKQGRQATTGKDTASYTPAVAGLLLDIHGHGHPTNMVEIGYLLSGEMLRMSDEKLDSQQVKLTRQSSVRSLISRVVGSSEPSPPPTMAGALESTFDNSYNHRQDDSQVDKRITFSTIIRGSSESLGGMFQRQEVDSIPSPKDPGPCEKCIFFSGNYTTVRHGTRDLEKHGIHTTDAIQLELPKKVRYVNTSEGQREVGMKLGRAVVEFMARYYGIFPEFAPESPQPQASEPVDPTTLASTRTTKPRDHHYHIGVKSIGRMKMDSAALCSESTGSMLSNIEPWVPLEIQTPSSLSTVSASSAVSPVRAGSAVAVVFVMAVVVSALLIGPKKLGIPFRRGENGRT